MVKLIPQNFLPYLESILYFPDYQLKYSVLIFSAISYISLELIMKFILLFNNCNL